MIRICEWWISEYGALVELYRQGKPSHSVNILSHSHSVDQKSKTDLTGIETRPPWWEAGHDAAEKNMRRIWNKLPTWCNGIFICFEFLQLEMFRAYTPIFRSNRCYNSYKCSIWCPWFLPGKVSVLRSVCAVGVLQCNTPTAHTLLRTDTLPGKNQGHHMLHL